MSKNYNEILNDLKESIDGLDKKGISIEPLNQSLAELEKHANNIQIIEENIEAIRMEVIDKIKEELDENKKAGKFSISGFYVGSIALVITIVTTILTFNSNSKLNQRLLEEIGINSDKQEVLNLNPNSLSTNSKNKSINDRLEQIELAIHNLAYNVTEYSNSYEPLINEYLLETDPFGYKKTNLLSDKNDTIQICAIHNYEEEFDNKLYPTSSIKVYKNGNSFGMYNLKENVKIISSINKSNYDIVNKALSVTEKDTIIFFNKYKFVVLRIYREQSDILKIADDKNAILIKKIN
jgi:hypothetical protein